MLAIKISSLAVMALFYLAYFFKMFMQYKKGVQTDQIGKGNKPKKVLTIEILMKIATYLIVLVEIISIIFDFVLLKSNVRWIGVSISFVGVCFFVVAVLSMKDSWRAGIPEKDKTELVTKGIYKISRNPAFLGFDLLYIGLLIAFFNFIHLVFVLYAVIMLHLQIIQEEEFLFKIFGEKYEVYKNKTARYFII